MIVDYGIAAPGPDAPIRSLSGGNVQRAVLARELHDDVALLIAANPCFGLDFAAVAEIRGRIMDARNRGAAVLLISADLDEIFTAGGPGAGHQRGEDRATRRPARRPTSA